MKIMCRKISGREILSFFKKKITARLLEFSIFWYDSICGSRIVGDSELFENSFLLFTEGHFVIELSGLHDEPGFRLDEFVIVCKDLVWQVLA